LYIEECIGVKNDTVLTTIGTSRSNSSHFHTNGNTYSPKTLLTPENHNLIEARVV